MGVATLQAGAHDFGDLANRSLFGEQLEKDGVRVVQDVLIPFIFGLAAQCSNTHIYLVCVTPT